MFLKFTDKEAQNLRLNHVQKQINYKQNLTPGSIFCLVYLNLKAIKKKKNFVLVTDITDSVFTYIVIHVP